jgi:hypothetical protein
MDTTKIRPDDVAAKKKGRAFNAACWNFFDTKGVGLILFWR